MRPVYGPWWALVAARVGALSGLLGASVPALVAILAAVVREAAR